MKLIFVGDVVSSIGCDHLRKSMPELKKTYSPDAIIVNGENSADGNGVTRESINHIFDSGAHFITTGNHCFKRFGSAELFDEIPYLIRPDNYSDNSPGVGSLVLDLGRYQLLIINLCGNAFMDGYYNAFDRVEEILKQADEKFILVDFHAEATSEKTAMGLFLDGKVSAMVGTHTHVQTADDVILPGGTAYITDVGMCGPFPSVLGISTETAIRNLRYSSPVKFEYSDSPAVLWGVYIELDDKTGKAVDFRRIKL